jgi:xanthine dehydrogenase YagS FAD-binding subunit
LRAFSYVAPASDREVVAALTPERNRTLPIAGGVDLLALMKDSVLSPERLVSLRSLDAAIATGDGGLRIGARAALTDIAEHGVVRRLYPALADAAGEIGTPQIRNQSTLGGNIMQRPRCWYFRNDEFLCLKKGGSRCHAVEGENRHHAIFGDGPCHIVHPSDLAVVIAAYGGRFRVLGPAGTRDIDADAFFQMPNVNLYTETVVQANEILTHIVLPAPPTRSAVYAVRVKQSWAWPLALAAVSLAMDGDTVLSARMVLGAVAPVPWRVPAAEHALVGRLVTESSAADAAVSALAGAKALSDNSYKVHVARTAVKRAILKAVGLPVVS